MNPDEVGKSYDQIADRWNGDRFPRTNGIRQHERAIAFLERRRFALDIGCGSSGRFIDLLLSRGFEVEGMDISETMVGLARQRHPDVTIHHGGEVMYRKTNPVICYTSLGIIISPDLIRTVSASYHRSRLCID